MTRLAIIFSLLATSALAQTEAAPDSSPIPPARPDSLTDETPAAEAEGEEEGELETMPGATPTEAEEAVPEAEPVFRAVASSYPEHAACLEELEEIGASFEEIEMVTEEDDRDCGILRPIELTEVLPGVTLEPAGTMRCETALALARWTRDHVRPSVAELPDSPEVTGLTNASSYVCRRRVGDPQEQPSEHSFGNAIDISAIELEGADPLPIQNRNGDADLLEAVQRATRAAGCLFYTTVLGPGTDPAHDDHFHFDVAERRGNYRICQ
ncbi:extensin-like domain-containing protein [Histidinibacterium aquaticum]|uniref:Extensin family protein n=1 Tax=Histidinibacterium aquaticum TaxID=2613962 RepID=A0A5J5GNH4_9RHOB|nr:extensin family protein [Histidinibacterium aquaticum]KAA9008992.1 extensin family protein [Histidinibacterium aquaticum]